MMQRMLYTRLLVTVTSASEYGCGMYDNAQENISSNTMSCEATIFHVLGMYMRYTFWCCRIPTKIPRKTFCDWWCIHNAFAPTCAVAFRTTHGQNKTCIFENEGFVPVDSLCGVVGSAYWFTKCLIVRTLNIWSVVYI